MKQSRSCKSPACTAATGTKEDSGSKDTSSQLRQRVQHAARPRPPSADGGLEEELWKHIWHCVEGDSVDTCRKRRRISGKQQEPVLDIVVYRRRLVGKQSAPEYPRKGLRSRGHYDVLGIQRSATAAEIHAAYRRCALATHPDKGGDPEDFRRVVAAFEELADEGRRACYDRSLQLFGRKDGNSKSAPEAHQPTKHAQAFGEARVSHYLLLSSANCSDALAEMSAAALEALNDLLEGRKIFARAKDDSKRGKVSEGQKCISQHRSGYKVTVSWASLQVCTGFTKSLAQAIDWQIALLWLRSIAEARIKQRKRTSAEPLTLDEVLEILRAEPTMELSFNMTLRVVGSKKVSTPVVQDLSFALELGKRFASLKSNAPAALQKVKRQAEKDAMQNRKSRKAGEQKLKEAVAQELRSRASPRSRGRKRKHDASRADCTSDPMGETRLVVWRPQWRLLRKTPADECIW
eukprot:CAMPEP_0197622730 /NCGR_PEP_ID=MMETSP1338-20131121/2904_1 /TAXON_ID=43686 ORGANISM="Pelagodinium beii, Strain RCC1491" /NCGR_SAMPLE_ID=MMETSP1338 /ASSEMBLY_ACC=CAM_ASM_000754 /LENGTH=462 /DNA_ID=CAMNT_0043192479 /DNA_START=67 /DNA_END=1452 /DNA_ORIENTATION=-